MYPILISIGPIHIFSFSIFFVLAWCVFSFIFWKSLRRIVPEEEHIFDLMYYATIVSLVTSRIAFVVFHWSLFSGSWLKVFALWIAPGLSLYGGLLGCIVAFAVLMRRYNIRMAHISDALALSLPAALFIGEIGSFLDGTEIGKITNLPFAVHYVGQLGARHPVQLYKMIVLAFIIGIILFIEKKAVAEKRPYGILGIWFFILYSLSIFLIEFAQSHDIYFYNLSANQWILTGIFCESLGALYVRGGGREIIQPKLREIQSKIVKKWEYAYAKFSKRRS